jgi:hypothetical protein
MISDLWDRVVEFFEDAVDFVVSKLSDLGDWLADRISDAASAVKHMPGSGPLERSFAKVVDKVGAKTLLIIVAVVSLGALIHAVVAAPSSEAVANYKEQQTIAHRYATQLGSDEPINDVPGLFFVEIDADEEELERIREELREAKRLQVEKEEREKEAALEKRRQRKEAHEERQRLREEAEERRRLQERERQRQEEEAQEEEVQEEDTEPAIEEDPAIEEEMVFEEDEYVADDEYFDDDEFFEEEQDEAPRLTSVHYDWADIDRNCSGKTCPSYPLCDICTDASCITCNGYLTDHTINWNGPQGEACRNRSTDLELDLDKVESARDGFGFPVSWDNTRKYIEAENRGFMTRGGPFEELYARMEGAYNYDWVLEFDYAQIIRDSQADIEPFVWQLLEESDARNDWERIEYLVNFVQDGFIYHQPPTIESNPVHGEVSVKGMHVPMHTLHLQWGDCDTKSVLLATMLRVIGVPTTLLVGPLGDDAHAFIGFQDFGGKCQTGRYTCMSYDNRKWLLVESTAPTRIGDMSSSFSQKYIHYLNRQQLAVVPVY